MEKLDSAGLASIIEILADSGPLLFEVKSDDRFNRSWFKMNFERKSGEIQVTQTNVTEVTRPLADILSDRPSSVETEIHKAKYLDT